MIGPVRSKGAIGYLLFATPSPRRPLNIGDVCLLNARYTSQTPYATAACPNGLLNRGRRQAGMLMRLISSNGKIELLRSRLKKRRLPQQTNGSECHCCTLRRSVCIFRLCHRTRVNHRFFRRIGQKEKKRKRERERISHSRAAGWTLVPG